MIRLRYPHALQAAIFFAFIVLAALVARAQQLDISPKETLLNVTVVDGGGQYVTGLGKTDFKVFDDTLPQEITSFSNDDKAASIGILLDLSESMAEWARRGFTSRIVKQAVSRFTQLGGKGNEYFIVAFDARPRLLLDWTDDVSAINSALAQLAEVKPKGNTALFDACYLGAEHLPRSKHDKRVLILITDGEDNASKQSFEKARRVMRESGSLIYGVLIRTVTQGGVVSEALAEESKSVLLDLALPSGGAVWFPEKPSEVLAAFESIAQELHHQYMIGFSSMNAGAGEKWHRIKVVVTSAQNAQREPRHLSIRSRQGYYSSATSH